MDPTLKNRLISTIRAEAPDLSPQMRQVARYVLDNESEFGLDPIRETARKAGVSTFTLVRMAKHLGFENFDGFREPFRHALVSATDKVEGRDWIEDWHGRGTGGETSALAALNSLSNVQRSLQRQTPEKIEAAVAMLLSARRVYLTAMRASYALAYHFHYVGRMALKTMTLVPRHMSNALDDLNDAGVGDVLLAITFSPYSQETIEAARFARAKGAKLILITDTEILAPDFRADLTLLVSTDSTHYFACSSGAMVVMEVLLAQLFRQGGDVAANRITEYERLRETTNAYWKAPKKH